MPEHNPDAVLSHQIGTWAGWRLLDSDEVIAKSKLRLPQTEWWHTVLKTWRKSACCVGNRRITYRTKLSRSRVAEIRSNPPMQEVMTPRAGGHNPLRLTEAYVGMHEGWRLLDRDEVGIEFQVAIHGLEMQMPKWKSWLVGSKLTASKVECCYRTQMSREVLALRRQVEVTAPINDLHNPSGLTSEQIGVAQGYRLLCVDEVGPEFSRPIAGLEYMARTSTTWAKNRRLQGSSLKGPYRTFLTREQVRAVRAGETVRLPDARIDLVPVEDERPKPVVLIRKRVRLLEL